MDWRLISRLAVAVLITTSTWAFPAAGTETVVGVASVIDADTLEIHGQRIRLHGIDAPESNQLCTNGGGKEWRCGQKAALALSDRIGRSPVFCEGLDTDRYGRIVSRCFVAGADINAWLVADGWAVAYRRYSKDYVAQEADAKNAGRGIWSGSFVMPWDWRRGQRVKQQAQSARSNGECTIKGNISSNGDRIYHVPGGRWYDQTKIDESKGERWFCSEDDAKAAKWRRSRQ